MSEKRWVQVPVSAVRAEFLAGRYGFSKEYRPAVRLVDGTAGSVDADAIANCLQQGCEVVGILERHERSLADFNPVERFLSFQNGASAFGTALGIFILWALSFWAVGRIVRAKHVDAHDERTRSQ